MVVRRRSKIVSQLCLLEFRNLALVVGGAIYLALLVFFVFLSKQTRVSYI